MAFAYIDPVHIFPLGSYFVSLLLFSSPFALFHLNLTLHDTPSPIYHSGLRCVSLAPRMLIPALPLSHWFSLFPLISLSLFHTIYLYVFQLVPIEQAFLGYVILFSPA